MSHWGAELLGLVVVLAPVAAQWLALRRLAFLNLVPKGLATIGILAAALYGVCLAWIRMESLATPWVGLASPIPWSRRCRPEAITRAR